VFLGLIEIVVICKWISFMAFLHNSSLSHVWITRKNFMSFFFWKSLNFFTFRLCILNWVLLRERKPLWGLKKIRFGKFEELSFLRYQNSNWPSLEKLNPGFPLKIVLNKKKIGIKWYKCLFRINEELQCNRDGNQWQIGKLMIWMKGQF
jgi:hypothetical protein